MTDLLFERGVGCFSPGDGMGIQCFWFYIIAVYPPVLFEVDGCIGKRGEFMEFGRVEFIQRLHGRQW